MFSFEDGVRIRGLETPLDPRLRADRAIVTHAHSDHVGRHRCWVTSPGTATLCARRWNARDLEVHEFNAPWREGEATVTLLPAGHILGSAMVLVECGGTRVLYTGDFRLRPAAIAEPCEPVDADVLVMECTFGDPHYRFPDRGGVLDEVCTFIEETLALDQVPVLIAYSLGKAQEVARAMSQRGYAVSLHPRAWAMLEAYRELGVRFENCTPCEMRPMRRGILIVPPGKSGSSLARQFGKRRTAFLSGWALGPPARRMGRWDAAFALSDHADYDELLEMVARVRPKRIYTLHGPDAFAARLRARGHDAWPAHDVARGEAPAEYPPLEAQLQLFN